MIGGGKQPTRNKTHQNEVHTHFKPFFFRIDSEDHYSGIVYLADSPPVVRYEGVLPAYSCIGSRPYGYYDGKMVWHIRNPDKGGYRDDMPDAAMFDRHYVSEMRPHVNHQISRPNQLCTLFKDEKSYWFVDNELIQTRTRLRTKSKSQTKSRTYKKQTRRQRTISRRK